MKVESGAFPGTDPVLDEGGGDMGVVGIRGDDDKVDLFCIDAGVLDGPFPGPLAQLCERFFSLLR